MRPLAIAFAHPRQSFSYFGFVLGIQMSGQIKRQSLDINQLK